MRRVNEPFDPRDPSRSGSGPREVSAARERLREEFEQLRVEIEELGAEESGGDPPVGGGFRGKARASVAALALSAAIAAAAGNFALNGGRTSKEGSVSVPPSSSEPESGAIAAGRGIGRTPGSLLSLIGPGLQTDILGSNAGPPGAGPPSSGPSPLFVVGDPVSVSGHGSRGGGVAGGHPVSHSPTPTPPAPEPDATQLAFSPPPPGKARKGPGKGSDHAGKPGGGGHTPAAFEDSPADVGGGPPAKGHVKAPGKGHGEAPGKGHEKDQDPVEVPGSGTDDNGAPGGGPKGHGPRGHGPGGSHGGGPPSAAPPPAPSSPPPGPGPDGNPGKGGGPDADHGKSTAPGQSGK